MSSQINELRLQVERLDYDNKEGLITVDILKEQNQDVKGELEEVRKQLADLKTTQKDPSAEDKEKRKQDKMALMMAKFDSVSSIPYHRHSFSLLTFQTAGRILRQGRAITTNSCEVRYHRLSRASHLGGPHQYPKTTFRRTEFDEGNGG
jgi:hypothetical protein